MFLTKNWLCKLSFTERSVIEIYAADYISKKIMWLFLFARKSEGQIYTKKT